MFGYFADRYGFEIIGAVIPGGSTTDGASAGELAELAEQIEAEGVPAIFADTSSSEAWLDSLAGEVGDVAVVELYSESLGEPGSDGATYVEMIRSNANADQLGARLISTAARRSTRPAESGAVRRSRRRCRGGRGDGCRRRKLGRVG